MYRDPRILVMAPRGDVVEYLCVMETNDHKIFASVSRFTRRDHFACREEAIVISYALEHAWRVLRRMVELDRPVPEGSMVEDIYKRGLEVMAEVGESPDVVVRTVPA